MHHRGGGQPAAMRTHASIVPAYPSPPERECEKGPVEPCFVCPGPVDLLSPAALQPMSPCQPTCLPTYPYIHRATTSPTLHPLIVLNMGASIQFLWDPARRVAPVPFGIPARSQDRPPPIPRARSLPYILDHVSVQTGPGPGAAGVIQPWKRPRARQNRALAE